LVYSSS
jgi:hypothetical protein